MTVRKKRQKPAVLECWKMRKCRIEVKRVEDLDCYTNGGGDDYIDGRSHLA